MTTKEYLRQIYRYDKVIQNKLSEIYQLRTMVSDISIAVKGDKVQTSGSKDLLGDTMAKVYDLERETNILIDQYVDKRAEIVNKIEALLKVKSDDRHEEYYDVLTARFVKFMDFNDIPDEVNMSERKMFYVYNEALKEFERLFGEEYLSLQ